MTSRQIETAIRAADISHGAALEGDCGAIARAIQSVFGGTYIIVECPDGSPRHAAVRINNTLYDGTGRTTVPTLVSLFVDPYSDGFPSREMDASLTVEACPYTTTSTDLSGFIQQPELTQMLETEFSTTLQAE